MSPRHRWVEDPARPPCARGCTRRNRHAPSCQTAHVDDCGGCLPRDAAPGSVLCQGCCERLPQWLAEMPALALELHRGLAPAHVIGGIPAMAESPDFPRKRAAVEHVAQIAHDLTWIAHRVADGRRLAGPAPAYTQAAHTPLRAVQALAGRLLVHAGWLTVQPEAGEWMGALAEDRGRAWGLIDRPPRSHYQLPKYRCPNCSAVLWANVYYGGDPRPCLIICEGEEQHTWDTLQWHGLGKRLLAREGAA